MLSSSLVVCERIRDERQGMQILKELLVCGEPELQFRGLYIVCHMMKASKVRVIFLSRAGTWEAAHLLNLPSLFRTWQSCSLSKKC